MTVKIFGVYEHTSTTKSDGSVAFLDRFPMIELAMRLGKKGKFFSLDTWDRAIERTDLKIKILNISRQTYTFISPTMAM